MYSTGTRGESLLDLRCLSHTFLICRNQRDLNRDFPDRIEQHGNLGATGKEQPETLAVMNWIQNRSFVGSADLHEGALVANYPWDADENGAHGVSAAPDDTVFVFLAKLYAQKHRLMHDSKVRKSLWNDHLFILKSLCP